MVHFAAHPAASLETRPKLGNHAASTPAVLPSKSIAASSARTERSFELPTGKAHRILLGNPPSEARPDARPVFTSSSSLFTPATSYYSTSTQRVPVEASASQLSRPALTSKFSTDDLTASSKKMVTKAWLQNIAAAARSSSTSPSSGSPVASTSLTTPVVEKKGINIGNPELIAYDGTRSAANVRLGSGARRVGKPAEAFSPPHVYIAPGRTSPAPPRRSEDSVRSYTSCSTNVSAQSYLSTSSSFSASRQAHRGASSNERANTFGTTKDRALPLLPLRIDSLAHMRQAVPGPSNISPDAAVEQLASTPLPQQGPSPRRHQRQRTNSSSADTAATCVDDIPFGHSAVSRPTSPELVHVTSPAASPNKAMPKSILKNSGGAQSSVSHKSEAPPGGGFSKPEQCASEVRAFAATLVRPIPAFPPFLSETDKLVAIHVGGNERIFTTSLANVTARQSALADFINSKLDGAASEPTSPASPLDAGVAPRKPQIMSPRRLPSQVALHLASPPISGLRSARASILDDVPSDEGEFVDDLADDYAQSPLPSRSRGQRGTFLTVPSMRIAKRRSVSGSTDSSCYSTSDNTLLNFIDATPDDEADDPFHFQRAQEQQPRALEQQYQDGHCSSSSQPPSLSSSPASSGDFFIGSLPVETKRPSAASLSAPRPFDSLRISQDANDRAIEIFLDRSPAAYESIFHYLREGRLPRRLQPATMTTDEPRSSEVSAVEVTLARLPAEIRTAILPLLWQPAMAELRDLRDEARFLGLAGLVELCEEELVQLGKLLALSAAEQAPRTAAGHPRKLKEEREKKSRPRPRLVDRHFHSDGSVLAGRSRAATPVIVDEDGWI